MCCIYKGSIAPPREKKLRPSKDKIAEKVSKFDANTGLLPQAKAKAKAKAAAKTVAAPKAAVPKPEVSGGSRGRGRGGRRARSGR